MRYLFCFALLLLAACSHSSQVTSYRPRGSNESAWNVKVEKNNLTEHVNVFVNDSVVCDGSIGLFESGSELKGDFHGHPVVAMIQKSSSFFGGEKMVCIVMIDGELAGKFEL